MVLLFCGVTVLCVHVMSRFREHPIIKGEPFFRFYAGCPLVTFQGLRLGTV